MFSRPFVASSSPPLSRRSCSCRPRRPTAGAGTTRRSWIRRSRPRSRTARAPSFSRQLLVQSELTLSWRCVPTTWPDSAAPAPPPRLLSPSPTPSSGPSSGTTRQPRFGRTTVPAPAARAPSRRQRTDHNGRVRRFPLGRRRVRRRGDARVDPCPCRPRAGTRKAPPQSPDPQLTVPRANPRRPPSLENRPHVVDADQHGVLHTGPAPSPPASLRSRRGSGR